MGYFSPWIFDEADYGTVSCEIGRCVHIGCCDWETVFQRPNCEVLLPWNDSFSYDSGGAEEEFCAFQCECSGGFWKIHVVAYEDPELVTMGFENFVLGAGDGDFLFATEEVDFELSSLYSSVRPDYWTAQADLSLDFLVECAQSDGDIVFLG